MRFRDLLARQEVRLMRVRTLVEPINQNVTRIFPMTAATNKRILQSAADLRSSRVQHDAQVYFLFALQLKSAPNI